MSFREVFVGDESIKLPFPFKKNRKWFREFEVLNQNKSKLRDEDEDETGAYLMIRNIGYLFSEDEDENGAYLMIRNIGYLFSEMGEFNCNKDKKNFFELWDKHESKIKKRIEVINSCLDVYDIIFPYTKRKPILSKNDLRSVHNLMDRILYDTCYPIMDECGVDLNMELGCPGWLDLKKVLLRFFSKINFDRAFEKFEEEVEGTGHIRPLYREDGSSLKGTGTFLLSFPKD